MLNNRCGASSIQKFLSIVLLEATSCPLLCGVTSVSAGGSLMGIFFFFFFFLFFSLSSPKHYNLDLFVGGISTSVIILLIFMFCFWSFYI
jgi:hypothetical protein